MGFPGGSDRKESAYNAGDLGLIPESGRSPGERNGYLLEYAGLENSMDRGAWQIQSMRSQSDTEQLTVLLSFFHKSILPAHTKNLAQRC